MKKREFAINVSILSILIVLVVCLNYIDNKRFSSIQNNSIEDVVAVTELANQLEESNEEDITTSENIEESTEEIIEETEPVVFEDMTLMALTEQLNKSLHSDLTGTGYLFAKYAVEYNVDPFLAVAIALHETGCNSNCSEKVTLCNNVGGQKFSPTCYVGGTYGRYDTLEEGIEGFISNISNNYIQEGLTTPELMQGKYVGNTTSPWSTKVNNYIEKIRSA